MNQQEVEAKLRQYWGVKAGERFQTTVDQNDVLNIATLLTRQPQPVMERMALFQWGRVRLHSGAISNFKIECDALTDKDWEAIAVDVAERVSFSAVVGVPTGGIRFAEALKPHCTEGPVLIVDDVLTTGSSMEEARTEIALPDDQIVGVVLFARGPCPSWVQPAYQRWPDQPQTVTERGTPFTVAEIRERFEAGKTWNGDMEALLETAAATQQRIQALQPKDAPELQQEADAQA